MMVAMTTQSTSATLAAAVAALLVAHPAAGQTGADPQPYSGLERREIKALSTAEIDDYRNGRGMSLALAAELNGYPGPRHVLDLAERLDLTPEQRARTQVLFDDMQREAAAIGEQIVAREAELDARFAGATVQEDEIEALAVLIGRLNGRLRSVHLRTHLAMRALLRPEQIAAYAEPRGYRPRPGDSGHHGRHGHAHTGGG